MNNWNLFLTDYKCLYAKEHYVDLQAFMKSAKKWQVKYGFKDFIANKT